MIIIMPCFWICLLFLFAILIFQLLSCEFLEQKAFPEMDRLMGNFINKKWSFLNN